MPIARTLLLREPGLVTFDSATFYSQGDVTVTPVIARSSQRTAAHGTVDNTRIIDRMFRITFTPHGAIAGLDKLMGPLALAMGSSVFGATDKPLVINTRAGKQYTFTSAAVTSPPPVRLSVRETLFGEVEFMAICGSNLDPNLVASYYAIASVAYPGDAGFDPAAIITAPWAAAWGSSSPWSAIETREGWTITPQITLVTDTIEGIGATDMKITDAVVTASSQPANVTQSDVLTKLGFGTKLGASRTGDDLVLTQADVEYEMTISGAVLNESALAFGDSPTIGALTWQATRSFADGSPLPLVMFADTEDEEPDPE